MSKHFIGVALVLAGLTASSPAAVYVWNNSSTDNQWTNSLNWTPNGLPGSADTATFNDTMIGTCRIGANVTVALMIVSNSSGTVDFDIPSGVTLATVNYRQAYIVTNTDNHVIMRGGGTFAPTGDVVLAFKDSTGGALLTKAELVVSNLVFDSTYLNNLWVSENIHSIGAMTGTLDLANATLVWQGSTNMLATKASLIVGGENFASGKSAGTLLFPGTLTNITVGTAFKFGSGAGGPNIMDFGTDPALRSISVASDVIIRPGLFRYNLGGATITGFPNQVNVTIGSITNQVKFYAGYYYSAYAPVVLTNFSSFNAWLSELYICQVDNNGAGTCYAELDLSENSVTNLAGSITPTSMSVSNIVIGGAAGHPYGVLRLPSSLTNIWCNTFGMGSIVGFGTTTPAITNCLVTFGTNTQPITFTVASNLTLGFADFKSIGPGGVTNLAFPPGSRLRVGSPTSRGNVNLGYIMNATGAKYLFGKGFSDVALYATNMAIGLSTANNGYNHYVTNDFREATQFMWNVRGDISMGTGIGEFDYTYLPANGAVVCSNMIMGRTGTVGYASWRALLVLSNTVFAVSNAVTLKETAIVTNYVAGISSGFDIGTTNLDIQDPQATNVYADYGRLAIRFASDPLDLGQAYWGLRLKGNAVGVIQNLTNTVPQRLSWTTDGLSQKVRARFGIYYDDARDVTYVGVKPLVPGMILKVY